MNNLLLISMPGLNILLSLPGMPLEEESLGVLQIFDYILRIGGFMGLILLIKNGTFINTVYFKVALGIALVAVVGAFADIEQIAGYEKPIVVTGVIAIALLYVFSALKKPAKKRLDYLKMAWVLVNNTLAVLIFFHLIQRDYALLGIALLWAMIVDFFYSGWKDGSLFE